MDSKETQQCLLDTIGLTHRDRSGMNMTVTCSRQLGHSTDRGKWTYISPLTKKPLAFDTCLERENQFSPIVSLGILVTFQGRSQGQE